MTEAEVFIGSIFLEDRSVVDLLTANHTFLNERLARHYGISGVLGTQFRKVTLTEKERVGLLGKAAVLMRTSYGDRTSPVLRGAWVLDKLIGTPPTPPPPNTATDLSQKAGEKPKTVRARLEQHRDKASCKQCHGVIDPTGLALENFDAIGQWRTDGPPGATLRSMRARCCRTACRSMVSSNSARSWSSSPETFVGAVTERLMMYAVNRQLEYFDMPQVRPIVRGAAKDNYKLSSLVLGIVNTDAFRKQGPAAAPKARSQRRRRSKAWPETRLDVRRTHVYYQKTYFPQNSPEGRGRHTGLPFLDAMVPASTALAQTAAVPKDTDRLLLPSAWRDHGQHVAWSVHG